MGRVEAFRQVLVDGRVVQLPEDSAGDARSVARDLRVRAVLDVRAFRDDAAGGRRLACEVKDRKHTSARNVLQFH